MSLQNNSGEEQEGCSGFCNRCQREHCLDGKAARPLARQLMEQMDVQGRIDFLDLSSQPDPCCTTDSLFSTNRGKMFGVLLCRDGLGRERVLYAFSGQFNGRWHVPGWVDPLFEVDAFYRCQDEREREIKAMGRSMDEEIPGSETWKILKKMRRQLSRDLMQDIFSLYSFPNFRGEECSLTAVYAGKAGIPTGTGDCCAPKLLGCAARHDLTPLSLVEFYYGRKNASGNCMHKHFYSPCAARCQPILGFMLCGL